MCSENSKIGNKCVKTCWTQLNYWLPVLGQSYLFYLLAPGSRCTKIYLATNRHSYQVQKMLKLELEMCSEKTKIGNRGVKMCWTQLNYWLPAGAPDFQGRGQYGKFWYLSKTQLRLSALLRRFFLQKMVAGWTSPIKKQVSTWKTFQHVFYPLSCLVATNLSGWPPATRTENDPNRTIC